MARWKARAEFLLSVVELLLSYGWCATRQSVKTRSLQEWVGHLEPSCQRQAVVPGEYFLFSTKLETFLLSDSANCTVLCAVVLTQYRRVTDRQTDRQTDGIAIASTALLMRCAVKTC